ncbi:SH3 domain-containing protein [Zopfochytrium polystomum]|nr:SH3 domain-containing protein [Zopfochytrium polystomum]
MATNELVEVVAAGLLVIMAPTVPVTAAERSRKGFYSEAKTRPRVTSASVIEAIGLCSPSTGRGHRMAIRPATKTSKDSVARRGSSAFSTATCKIVAEALYDYDAQTDEDLTFKEGAVLLVIDDSDQDWWTCKERVNDAFSDGKEGLAPAAYIQEVEPVDLDGRLI